MAKRRKSNDLDNLIIGILVCLGILSAPFLLLQNTHFDTTQIGIVITGCIMFIFVLVFIFVKISRRRRIIRIEFSQIDSLSGRDFEWYVAQLLEKQGYKTRVVGGVNHGDYGADIIAEKDGVKTAVQTKRWSWNVGIEAVYQAVGSAKYYHCTQAMVVTNNYFTQPAINLAQANKCLLIDRDKLKSWVG